MHTFLKNGAGEYWVGMWLPVPDRGASFQSMFQMRSISEAMRMVSFLNGGKGNPVFPHLSVFKEAE
jgi:hypothetical protein